MPRSDLGCQEVPQGLDVRVDTRDLGARVGEELETWMIMPCSAALFREIRFLERHDLVHAGWRAMS